jgi:hypothetical protein
MSGRRRNLKREQGFCFWRQCGPTQLTLDHTPPKAIFPKRLHSKVPAVWSCDACNKEWRDDAKYFRDYLAIGPLAKCQHPDWIEIRDTAAGDLKWRERRGRPSTLFRDEHGVTVTYLKPSQEVGNLYPLFQRKPV